MVHGKKCSSLKSNGPEELNTFLSLGKLEEEVLGLFVISDYCILSRCGQVTCRQGKWLFEKTNRTPLTREHSQVCQTNQGVKVGRG